MKTSDKWLVGLASALFLGTAAYDVASRLIQGREFSFYKKVIPASDENRDSGFVVVPGDRVRWNTITLGLKRSARGKVVEENSIFRDIHLNYVDHGDFSRNPFNFLSRECRFYHAYFEIVYQNALADTNRNGDPLLQGRDWIRIHVRKFAREPIPDKLDLFWKKRANAVESEPGYWEYWSQNAALCEWTRGRWKTEIEVPLLACNRDSLETLALRDRIRDRIFTYYRTLK